MKSPGVKAGAGRGGSCLLQRLQKLATLLVAGLHGGHASALQKSLRKKEAGSVALFARAE